MIRGWFKHGEANISYGCCFSIMCLKVFLLSHSRQYFRITFIPKEKLSRTQNFIKHQRAILILALNGLNMLRLPLRQYQRIHIVLKRWEGEINKPHNHALRMPFWLLS